MSTWADYLVSKVCYDSSKNHIKEVEIRIDKGETISAPQGNFSRSKVISLLKRDKSFCTIFKQDSRWNKGAEIGIVKVDREEFIRTDKNEIKNDNLGDLPEYKC